MRLAELFFFIFERKLLRVKKYRVARNLVVESFIFMILRQYADDLHSHFERPAT